MTAPRISVVMPVYNASPYLEEAITSILNQTFSDFEFLIYDDASSDDSRAIIDKYASLDSRIVPTYSNENRGYIFHLNHSLDIFKGDYFARMDADDVSLPERLERQINFLVSNPEYGGVGTWFELISKEEEHKVIKNPTAINKLRSLILYQSVLAHPTVMLRGSLFKQHHIKYDTAFYPAEDYDLWTRLLRKGIKITNIGEKLLLYRVHQSQTSSLRSLTQVKRTIEISEREILNFIRRYAPKKKMVMINFPEVIKFIKKNEIELSKDFDVDDLLNSVKLAWKRNVDFKHSYSYNDLGKVFSAEWIKIFSFFYTAKYILKCIILFKKKIE